MMKRLIARSISSLSPHRSMSSLHRPPGGSPALPSGFVYGLDPLPAADLHAIFTLGSPSIAPLDEDIKWQFPDKVFPAISHCPEKACIDNTIGEKHFMKIYELQERSSKGKGLVKVSITEEPNDGSPSQPIFNNPAEGIQVILDSVFRTQLSMDDSSTVFTSWVACPPFAPQEPAVCYTSGHSFAKDYYGLPYSAEGVAFGWQAGTGCFGSLVKTKRLWNGFEIDAKPLAVTYDSIEDFACFQAHSGDADFLLPCSPEEIQVGGFVASFGYPCVESFLQRARKELVLKNGNYGVGELYNYLATDTDSLYMLLQDTFGCFTEGQLLCSPGILTSKNENVLHIKSSTLMGASGSPVIPTGLPGYTIGIHKGGTHVDANIAVSTDSRGFVDSYGKHVLPHLPSPDHAVFRCRDLGPFRRWLDKHGLTWYQHMDAQQCFVTPPPTESRRIMWAID